jgi:hypothetical protein
MISHHKEKPMTIRLRKPRSAKGASKAIEHIADLWMLGYSFRWAAIKCCSPAVAFSDDVELRW